MSRAAALVFFLLSGSVLVVTTARAQTADQPVPGYVMKRWTTGDGLPHNSIQALLQTRDGYLWIGTDGGLVQFDGVTFATFNLLNTPALQSDRIRALYEDEDGTLWIGTYAGLVRYRDGVFTSESLSDDVAPGPISDIRSDREGHLWVAGQRVIRREGQRWTVIAAGVIGAHPLAALPDGTMWIATSDGLVEWRDRIVRTLTERDGLSGTLWALYADREGRVWVGTNRGLFMLDTRSGDAPAVARVAMLPGPIATLFEDGRGRLWIGSNGRLFVRAPDGAMTQSIVPNETALVEPRAFIEDRDGQMWFGPGGGAGGLYRLTPERVKTITHHQGLPCDGVGPVSEAPDGAIWFATLCTDGRGVGVVRDGSVRLYEGPQYVESLLIEPDGSIWVGTFGGALWQWNGREFRQISSPTSDPKAEIAVIHRHVDGALWLGTNQGVFRQEHGQWTHIGTGEGLVTDDVRSIVSQRDGSLWIGTAAGVSRYQDGRFSNLTAADGVPSAPVRAIHVDADGIVWLGTYGGGLARIKNGVVHAYGVQGGALDSSVHRILEDQQGFFWLSGDHGIRRVSKHDLNAAVDAPHATLDVRVFNEADGMRIAECNGMAQPAGWQARDGSFYFPTQGGIAYITPSAAEEAGAPRPKPLITGMSVDGVSMKLGEDLVVPPGYRDVELRYTAPVLSGPELVQFRYRLEGIDPDWVEIGTRRAVSLRNLTPGHYRFAVSARRAGGQWSERAAGVGFVLRPFLYQQAWFQIGLGLLVAIAGAGAGKLYVRALNQRAAELERAVTERTADLSVARDQLATANEDLTRAKRTVEEAHGQLLAVLDQLDIGVLVLSISGIVRYASASAQRVLRRDEYALVGQPWSACLPLIETDRRLLKERVERRSPVQGRTPMQLVIAGSRYWVEIDVRDEPPPGDGRILYLYDAAEVSAQTDESRSGGLLGLVGRSTAMHVVYRQIRDVARVDSTVLIQGETGVGKELVARAIHRESRRADQPFIAVNAAGLTESLLASQLFGHRRGAFTGAVDDQTGVFEAANGGTLFLDEIGDMPPGVQVSLLRVVQEREITRLGESQPRRVDVRFLAATHRDLAKEVEEGRFREDLLYRVRVASIVVPPLRDRIDDVPLLVDAFLREAGHPGREAPEMSREAMETLMRYAWPGNVRELRAAIERALVTVQGGIIRGVDLPAPIGTLTKAEDEDSERERIVDALRRADGNRAKAARLLGMGRTSFYRRLWQYGLDKTNPD
jgi:transcriptional regulator with PAS, ATPase and Fis domain/ligand-binding sensor domain-containing protein